MAAGAYIRPLSRLATPAVKQRQHHNTTQRSTLLMNPRQYFRSVFSACLLSVLLASPASATCQLTYLGCYVDSPDRLLSTQTADAFTCLTRQYCASLCTSVGAPISGGEFAGQCFCGPSLPSSAVKAPESGCNMACSGDAQTHCGGNYCTFGYSYQLLTELVYKFVQ